MKVPIGLRPTRFAVSLLLGCTALAEDAPLPEREPNVVKTQGEHAGDSLLISEPVEQEQLGAGDPVAEPVSLVDGGGAGHGGRWRVEPHLQVKGTYDDNIFIQPNRKVADYITTISPGMALGFWDSVEARERDLNRARGLATAVERSRGNYLILDYTAILLGFARTTSQNALDHDLRLDAQWVGEKLTLGASVHAESKSETNRDVGGRLRRKQLSSALTSSYRISPNTTLGLAFYNTATDPVGFARTVEWRAEGTLDYAVTPRARFGFGLAGGLLQIQSRADQVFERVLARAGYSLSEKVDVDFRGGVEFRQSQGPAGDRTNPIVDLRVVWTPASETRIGLSAYRRVETPIERPEEFIEVTGVALSLLQAMRGDFYFSFDAGFEVADYIGESRRDRYFFLRPGFFYHFAQWGTAGVTYERKENHSSVGASGFGDNQVSLEFNMKF